MVKKGKWIILAAIIVGLGFLPVTANAQPKGAVVIKDTSCIVFDVDGIKTFEVLDTVKVTTPSRNCNRNVSCHGDLLDGSLSPAPDKAVKLDYDNTNWVCEVNFDGVWVSTTRWHQVITPTGNITLTCHFKGCIAAPPTPPLCTLDPYDSYNHCPTDAPFPIPCYQDAYEVCCTEGYISYSEDFGMWLCIG